MQETWVRSLGREDPLKKEMATHSSILAWRIPWMEEPGGLQSMGSKESDTTERLHFHSFTFISSHRTGKGQFSVQSQRRAMPKNVQTTTQLYSFYIIARWCSKSFKLGFSCTWTVNFQMYKLDLKKAEEPEIKLPIFTESLGSLMCYSPWGCKSKSWFSDCTRPTAK